LSFSGQSQQYLEASGGVWVTFVFAILIVFPGAGRLSLKASCTR
jgi:hypothetical protein